MRFVTAAWVMLAALCTLAPLPVANAGGGKTMIVAIDPYIQKRFIIDAYMLKSFSFDF